MIEKVTLKDIARDTGLSISTVSRAIAGSGKISKESERKVFESANRLNYPLANGRTPIEHRENIRIALVTRHSTGEFYASLFEGFDRSARSVKASVSQVSIAHSPSPVKKLLSELIKNRYDAAVLFLPELISADYLKMLETVSEDFPVISIAPITNPVMDTVTFDHYRGGYLVAAHFIERGFQHVGIIQGPVKQSEAMLRKNGFIDAIQASGSQKVVWKFNGDFSFQNGREAYNEFKNLTRRPEAVFCSNDSMALGFMHSALRDGVHIPEDVAIAGFDDLPVCTLYTPTITSVNTPYDLLGEKTLELVFNRLEKRTEGQHKGFTNVVPVSLRVRESSTELSGSFQNYYPGRRDQSPD